ncbi:MAG TPA: hypothetical protein PLF98_06335, partial [Thermotogota bacterium]|nr:hypothetical protein [Thermotogota bacterium]
TNWIEIEPFNTKGYIREAEKKDGWGRLTQIDEGFGVKSMSEGQKPLPKQFDHLKWKFNNNQKYYLDELCSVDPNSITESDIKSASKFLGVPEKNVKSILNTYNVYDPMSEAVFEGDPKSPFRLGNKPVTVGDAMTTDEANRAPVRANRTTWPTQDTVTPAYRKTMSKAESFLKLSAKSTPATSAKTMRIGTTGIKIAATAMPHTHSKRNKIGWFFMVSLHQ